MNFSYTGQRSAQSENHSKNPCLSLLCSLFMLLHLVVFVFILIHDDKNLLNSVNTQILTLHVQKTETLHDVDFISFIRNRHEYLKESIIDLSGSSAFLQSGGIIPAVDIRARLLCRYDIHKHCLTNHIADSIDLAISFAPLYAINQKEQEDLYYLHDNFVNMLKVIGIKTQVVEAIIPFRKQVYKRTQPGREPWEIQVVTNDTFYYRENLLNVAAQKTLDLWEYMFWIDAHQAFNNSYWWEEAILKAEHVNAVHLAQQANYFDGNNKTTWFWLKTVTYVYTWRNAVEGTNYFAGNGWAMRKEIYLRLGHIIDECVAGGCDYSLVLSLMKSDNDWDGFAKSPFYFEQLKPLIDRSREILKGSYATLRGHFFHFEHSHLFDYWGSQSSFATCCINFEKDMKRDDNFMLHSTNPEFRAHFK